MHDFHSEVPVETPLHYYLGRTSGESAETGLVICEAVLKTHLVLRGDPGDPDFKQGVESALDVGLPVQACSFETRGETGIYWLGPDEWLVTSSGNNAHGMEAELRRHLSRHFSVVDVSGGQTIVNLSGSAVGYVLKKSCAYDFSPRNFQAGRCVQTTFAKATALVARNADGTFDLVFRRSFADYLAEWLLDAGAEYGCVIKSR